MLKGHVEEGQRFDYQKVIEEHKSHAPYPGYYDEHSVSETITSYGKRINVTEYKHGVSIAKIED